MKCPFCEAAVIPGKRFCPECGKYLSPEIRNAEAAQAEAQEPVSVTAESVEPETEAPAAAPVIEAPVFEEPKNEPPEETPVEAEPVPEEAPEPVAESANDVAENDVPAQEHEPLSVMPTDPNKPATADLMIPVEPDPKPEKGSQWATVDTWGWIGIRLLMLVPIVNIVFLLIWSFGGTKKNVKQSWARATLVWVLVLMIFALGLLLYVLLHPSAALSIGDLF